MTRIRFTIPAFILLAAPVTSAALLLNGDFESFGTDLNTRPTNWPAAHGDTVTTQVTGLDGSGSAVQMGLASATGSSSSSISQTVASTTNFSFQFDFSLLDSGVNSDENGQRILNFTLRNSTGGLIINARSLFDGTTNAGALQFHNGTAWQSISDQTELFNQTDVYRLSLNGSLATGSRKFTVSLLNLTHNTSAGGESDITNFSTGIGGISQVIFERGRSNADYIVDNAILIPEPSVSALTLLAGSCFFLKRRR